MTTTLEIGRLHARYAGEAAAQAGELDLALRRVAEEGLEAEVPEVRLPEAFAVCVPDITVAVRLDPGRPVASTSRDWARAIVEGVRQRLADGRGVVTYLRQADALVDLVRSTAEQDWTRRWAWTQSGLVGAGFPGPAPYGGAVAEVLARHPEWVAAVLVRAGTAPGLVLGARDWVRLAGVVRRAVGGPVPQTPARTAVSATPSTSPDRTVPRSVWEEVHTADDRWNLAVLALAMGDPARSRHPHAVAAVLTAAPGAGPQPKPARDVHPGADGTGRASRGPDAVAAGDPDLGPAVESRGAWVGPQERTAEELTAEGAVDRQVLTSSWGGVLYCIHAVSALGLVEELAQSEPGGGDVTVALARVLGKVTGAPPDDPAVMAAAGCQQPQDGWEPLTPDARERRDAQASGVSAWFADRLDEQPDADLGWVWSRPVRLESEPGWLDATFPLSSVDTRLRLAGLDLDPGHVWWLGGVVRFHHV